MIYSTESGIDGLCCNEFLQIVSNPRDVIKNKPLTAIIMDFSAQQILSTLKNFISAIIDDPERRQCQKAIEEMLSTGEISESGMAIYRKYYTLKARQRRREEVICLEIMMTLLLDPLYPQTGSHYTFGSYIEYTQIPKSDLDGLVCDENLQVVNNPRDVIVLDIPFAAMVIYCSATPGYVKLQILYYGKPITVSDREHHLLSSCTMYDGDGRLVYSCIPKKGFNENFPEHGPALVVHEFGGFKGPKLLDFVTAYRYKSWPSIANDWIYRERKHDWPSIDNIERFQKLGCFLVKAGSPKSEEKHLEWRISFSLQERELMFGLNDVQHECYLILKRMKQDFLNDENNNPISSYHCKTCLFYTIERNSSSIWVPEKLMFCVTTCLEFLQECVISRNCPNYFIAGENMFARIEDDGVWTNVAEKLKNQLINFENNFEHVLVSDCDQVRECVLSIFWSNTIQFVNVFLYSVRPLLHCFKSLEMLSDSVKNREKHIPKIIKTLKQRLTLLKGIETITEHTPNDTKTMIHLVVPFIYTIIGSHFAAYSLVCETLHVSEKMDLEISAGKYLNMGISSDSTSGHLKEVTFMFIKGQYDTCLKELISLEQLDWDAVFNISSLSGGSRRSPYSSLNFDKIRELVTKYSSIKEYFGYCCSAFVLFAPTEIDLMPFALQIELFKKSTQTSELFCNFVFIDSQIYMYFMLYLTYTKMNKTRNERIHIIEKMKKILPNMYHVSTANNLIAWASAEEGLIKDAMEHFVLSWIDNRYGIDEWLRLHLFQETNLYQFIIGKSAPWHFLILLHRLWSPDSIYNVETSYQIYFCFNCLKQELVTMQKCSKCEIARYCTESCQKENWSVHKNICKMIN